MKFEYGFGRFFRIFSLILKKKKRVDRAAILLSNDKHNSACYYLDNYIDRAYVNIWPTQSTNATAYSTDMAGERKRLNWQVSTILAE